MQVRLPARSAQHACLGFIRALNAADLVTATACFSREACLITPDATAVRGRQGIGAVLAQLIARRLEIRVEASHLLAAGDVTMARERWMVRSNGVEGSRLEQALSATLVLRLIEGEWKLAIVAPWGGGNGR